MKELRFILSSLVVAPLLLFAQTPSTIVIESQVANELTGDEKKTPDSAGTCLNFQMTTTCEKCGTCPSENNSTGEIQSGGMRVQTSSDDYSPASGSSCSSCSGGSGGSDSLPSLTLSRHSEPLSYSREHLTFGSEQGLKGFDQCLIFNKSQTAIEFTDYGSIHSKRSLSFNPTQLCWTEAGINRDQGVAAIYLFNAAGLPIITAATRDTAHTAILLNFDGSSVHFEILWDANLTGLARSTAFLDRHGNAIEIEYVDAHPAFGTPAIENFRPYFRKSLMRDAYGRVAHFTYEKLFQRYVTTRIDLPNGAQVNYHYSYNGGVKLDKVTHADGTESFWFKYVNTVTKLDEYTIFDAKAAPGQRRKRFYFSQDKGFAPGGGLISTTRARIRRAQNGAGEFVWDSKFTSDLQDRYIYQGGNSVSRFTFYTHGRGLGKVEHITNDLWKGDFHQGDQTVWTRETELENVQNNGRHFPVLNEDSRNRTLSLTRAPLSNEVVGSQYPDGTSEVLTRNQFTQPLVSTDRLGRISANTYSPLGDLLSSTSAVGTADETTQTFLYNTRGQIIESRDALYDANFPDLHNTRFEYDANGYLVKKIEAADVSGGTRPQALFTYDAAGRLTSSTDPVGRVSSYQYDAENRLIKTTYGDTSTDRVQYGTGLLANLVVKTTDRNGYETTYTYDSADRKIATVTAANTDHPSTEICTYLYGTRLKETCTINGSKTTYLFDHRNRVVGTVTKTSPTKELLSSTELDELSRTRSTTDPFGRKTFYLYDQNDRVIRTVTETVPGGLVGVPAFTSAASQTSAKKNYSFTDKNGTLLKTDPNNQGRTHEVSYSDPRDIFLKNLVRDLSPNATFLISDRIHDAEGQLLASTDPRGIVTWMEYDKLGRNTLTINALGTQAEVRSQSIYDDNSNVIESRGSRFFSEGPGFDHDSYSYTGRNLRKQHTTAVGSTIQASQSWTYYADGRNNEHTDFRGNTTKQIWHACCARLQASIASDGQSTSIQNTDYEGQPIHSAVVTLNNQAPNTYPWYNPVDANTLQETTTRFDGRGRPTFTTVWLNPLGNIFDSCCGGAPAGVLPIAGLDGVPASNGLTTSYLYDDDLTDGRRRQQVLLRSR
jgi:YD repeat-containing protein